MRKINAVYTVELALVMPIVLLTIFLPLHSAIDLYSEIKSASECRWDQEMDAVKELRGFRVAEELLGGK